MSASSTDRGISGYHPSPGDRQSRLGAASRFLPRRVQSNLILLLALVLLPILVAQTLVYYRHFQARQEVELRASMELSRSISATFDAFVRDLANQELAVGIALASSPAPSEELVQRLLSESVRGAVAARSFSWVAPSGRVLASSAPGNVGLELADRPHLQQLLSGREWVVSDLVMGRGSGEATFVVARAARDERGAVAGVVLASLDPTRLGDVIQVTRSSDALVLVDAQGRLVYEYPELPLSWDDRSRTQADATLTGAVAGDVTSGQVIGSDGVDRMVATVPIRSAGWAAGTSIPVEQLSSSVLASLLPDMAASLLVFLMVCGLAVVFSRRITLPIAGLREASAALARGELSKPLPTTGPVELAELAGAFNEMAGAIQARESQYGHLLEEIDIQRRLFRTLVANAPVGIAILDGKDLHVRLASDAFLRFLDEPYRREGIVGLRVRDFIPRAEESDFLDQLRRVAASREPHHEAEYRHEGFDRGVTFWQWSMLPLGAEGEDEDDLMLLLVETTDQVLARQRVEELASNLKSSNLQLVAEQARLKAIIDSAPEGVVVADRGGRILLTNPAADRIYARPVPYGQELESHASLQLCHPDGSPCDPADLPLSRSALRSETLVNEELCILWPDGQSRDLLVNSAPILDGQGNSHGAVAVFRDLTERNRSERSRGLLAEASALLAGTMDYEQALVEVARLVVTDFADSCIVDLIEGEMVQTIAISDADPEQEAILRAHAQQYAPTTSIDHPSMRVLRTGRSELYPEVPEEMVQSMVASMGRPSAATPLYPSVMAVPIEARGRTFGAITLAARRPGRRFGSGDLRLAEDLAHRCGMAVDNARLYRQAQDAITARDEFLSVASHELRTPMTSLRGFTQLTIKQLAKEESPDLERVRQALNVIDQQSARLSSLISQLLDVSRLEAGRLALDRRAVDLVEVVSQARDAAQSVSTQHSLLVRSPASVTVLGDGIRLGQVVSNLLDNAIKYSPYGGEVEVDLSQPSGELARLAVRDHGVGVPPEHREHIFDRFYQANTLGGFGGLGLGLYISREIVQLHGGGIDVEYPEDGGTRFVVTLPTGMRATTD